MFNNWFRDRDNGERGHHDSEVEVDLTDSTGRTIGTQIMPRSEALEHGYDLIDAPERERLADEITLQAGEVAQHEGVLHQGFNVNQRMNIANPEVPHFLTERANESRSFGQKTKTFIVGLVAGTDAAAAITYKTAVGAGVRSAIKHTLNFAAPGAGAAVGAVVGGSWEGVKASRQESQRVEAEQARYREALEAITGTEDRMEELLKMRNESDVEHLSPEQQHVLEQYRAVKKDRKKIGIAILKGAAIGCLGGAVGGALIEVASYGLHHLADLEKLKAAGDAVKKVFQYTVKPGAPNVFRFENKDVVQDMSKSTWNTVKEWYRSSRN